MKLVSIAIIIGFILLYFVNAALKIDIFNSEMLMHSGIRFFTGFEGVHGSVTLVERCTTTPA